MYTIHNHDCILHENARSSVILGFAIEVAVRTNPSLMCEAVRKYLVSAKWYERRRHRESHRGRQTQAQRQTKRDTDKHRGTENTHTHTHTHTNLRAFFSYLAFMCIIASTGGSRVGLLVLQHRGAEAWTVAISASILPKGWNRATSVLECTTIDQESWLEP